MSVSNKVVTVEARLTASLYYCLRSGARIMEPWKSMADWESNSIGIIMMNEFCGMLA